MLHVRNTAHQDSEATVIKANRKHQIVLNMEVKRIEMEKKMRERYFCFEMSIMKARRLKIVDRQKSLGIYRPHTMENARNDSRKEGRTKSFFFTQSAAMNSKVKLPPVLEKRRTVPTLPMKLASNEDPRKISSLSKNINNANFYDKERAKRVHAAGKMKTFQEGNGHLKTQSKLLHVTESWKREKIEKNNLGKDMHQKNGGICKSAEILNKDLVIQEDQSHLQLDDKNVGVKNEAKVDEVKEGEFYEENRKGSEQGDSNCSNPGKDWSEERDLTGNLKSQLLSQKLSQEKGTSAQTQNICDFPSYQELQTWRRSLETRIVNPGKDYKATNRLRSVSLTACRENADIHEACAVSFRPHSA